MRWGPVCNESRDNASLSSLDRGRFQRFPARYIRWGIAGWLPQKGWTSWWKLQCELTEEFPCPCDQRDQSRTKWAADTRTSPGRYKCSRTVGTLTRDELWSLETAQLADDPHSRWQRCSWDIAAHADARARQVWISVLVVRARASVMHRESSSVGEKLSYGGGCTRGWDRMMAFSCETWEFVQWSEKLKYWKRETFSRRCLRFRIETESFSCGWEFNLQFAHLLFLLEVLDRMFYWFFTSLWVFNNFLRAR